MDKYKDLLPSDIWKTKIDIKAHNYWGKGDIKQKLKKG